MPKARGLGRGLAALIPDAGTGEAPKALPVAAIRRNPFQPRRHFDEGALAELADSIRRHGVLHPVLVRPRDGGYELIAGERRLLACRQAGMAEIPVLVRDWDDRTTMEVALVENLQRSDLNPVEEAEAFQRLIDEFGWTQDEAAERVGKSRSHVANYLRLLHLERGVRELVEGERLTMAHAKVLLSAEPGRRLALARRAADQGWTVRQLTAAAAAPDAGARPARAPDVHLEAAELRLAKSLGARVSIRGTAQRGRIVIRYGSLDELEALLVELQRGSEGEAGIGTFTV